MATPENWDLIANLFINPKNIDDLEKQFSSGLSKATKKWLDREVRGPVAKALGAGMAKGLREGLTGGDITRFVQTQVGGITQEIERTLRVSMAAERAGHSAWADSLQQKAQKLSRQLQKQTSDWQREGAIYERAFEEMQRDQIKTARSVAKTWQEGASRAGKVMSGALRGDLGGIMGELFGAGKRAGDKALKTGEGLVGKGQKIGGTQGAASIAKGKGMMGKGTKMNAYVKGAEIIYEVSKAFVSLDEQIVNMNRSMLDGFGIADMGLTRAQYGMGQLTDRIDEVRAATTGMNEQYTKFGLTYKDQQKMLSTLNQTGLTWRKMQKGAETAQDRAAEYGQTMNRVGTYARALGTSVEEMSSKFGEFAITTGYDDKTIAEGFSMITREAQAAGFATKRFYAAVTEAAGEMALWGFRIEETAQVMGQMGKLIGQKFGQDLAQTVQKSFQQDTIANYRDILLRDQEWVADEMGKEFEHQLGLFKQHIDNPHRAKRVEDLIKGAESETDLGVALKTLPYLTAEMDETAQRIYRLRQSATGGGPAVMEKSLREAGPGMAAIMRMRTAAPVQQFGGDIGEAIRTAEDTGNLAAVKAIKDTTHLSEEGFEELRRVAVQSADILGSIRKNGYENTKGAKELGLFMKDGVLMRGAITVDPDTEIQTIDEDNAIEVKDSNDILRGMLQDDEDLQMALKSDRKVAEEIAKQTKSMADAINQQIVGILETSYTELRFIADMLHGALGWMSDATRSGKEAGKEAGKSLLKEEEARKELKQAQKSGDSGKIADARKKLADAEKKTLESTKGTAVGSEGTLFGETAQTAKGAGTFLNERARKAAEATSKKADIAEDVTWANTSAQNEGWLEKLQTPFGYAAGKAGEQLTRFAAGATAPFRGDDALVILAMDEIEDMDPDDLTRFGGVSSLRQMAKEAAVETRKEIPDEGLGIDDAAITRFRQIFATIKADRWKMANPGEGAGSGGGMGGDMGEGAGFLGGPAFFVQQMKNMQTADDLIIPRGGRPIMVNDQDDIMAFKSGGPISQALSGTNKGNFSVNVYGGNQQQVYATIMKALKAAGYA